MITSVLLAVLAYVAIWAGKRRVRWVQQAIREREARAADVFRKIDEETRRVYGEAAEGLRRHQRYLKEREHAREALEQMRALKISRLPRSTMNLSGQDRDIRRKNR